jgi:hypothetical protein
MTMNEPKDRRDANLLLGRLLGPAGPELSCEECFAQLDRYAELSIAVADPDQQVPGMRAHLEGCPACSEDYESLLAFLKGEPR